MEFTNERSGRSGAQQKQAATWLTPEQINWIRDAYLDLSPETARQLRRYQSSAWKTTEAVFPSRQTERMSKMSTQPNSDYGYTAGDVVHSYEDSGLDYVVDVLDGNLERKPDRVELY